MWRMFLRLNSHFYKYQVGLYSYANLCHNFYILLGLELSIAGYVKQYFFFCNYRVPEYPKQMKILSCLFVFLN